MGCSKFWIGMVAGAVVGAVAYRCACTEKAKQWKEAMCNKLRNAGGKAGGLLDGMKEKAVDTGVKVADKVAEKAEEARERAHNFARDMNK